MDRRLVKMIHKNCRNNIYPKTKVQRFTVPDNKVLWSLEFLEYCPVLFTSEILQGKSWADPNIDDTNFDPKWNELDGKINRVSCIVRYIIDKDNYPLNPCGRTGIKGRGLLGRWGPNHAADPIVTRWKRHIDGSITVEESTNKPILQFVSIQRQDTGKWALPGGMVDPGEKASFTMYREFMEEAMNSLQKNQNELNKSAKLITEFFKHGQEIYRGYVDDPRNTDNSWMETIVFNFHDESGKYTNKLNLDAGDDAINVNWIDINKNLILYASQKDFIMKVAEKHQAHW